VTREHLRFVKRHYCEPRPLAIINGCFDLFHVGHLRLIDTAPGVSQR
jgi:glycerol-3-phosphate cytidylyltransferase-like family protein